MPGPRPAHDIRENEFPKRSGFRALRPASSGPQFNEEPSSRSLPLSPTGTGAQLPLDFTFRSTLVTRKMFTDLSGFRAMTRGMPQPGKCSLAYLRSRLSAVGASSAQRCSWIYRERPMRERSVRLLGQHRWAGDIQAGPPFSIPAASKDDK
jgi:hypothetical protein